MRSSGKFLALASVLLVAGGFWLSSAAQEAEPSKLKTLLAERHSILKEVAAQISRAHKAGGVPITQVHEANQAMYEAELDLCDTIEERVAVLKKMLAAARDYERLVAKEVGAGEASTIATLRAKASRLEIEVALERAQTE